MSAAIALICFDDKILLFHRDNLPTIESPDCWGLPGGAAESGETADQTIKRELIEEISYVPLNLSFAFNTQDIHRDTAAIYMAFVDETEAQLFKIGSGEGQEIKFFTLDEALQLKLTPALGIYLSKFRNQIEEAMDKKQLPSPSPIDL